MTSTTQATDSRFSALFPIIGTAGAFISLFGVVLTISSMAMAMMR